MWYFIIAIAVILLFLLLKSYKKVNELSEQGTILVAFTKDAIPKTFLLKEIPVEEQYKKLMRACYLYNCFLEKTNGIRDDYNFSIIENGPVYGKVFDVKLRPFIQTVVGALQKKANSLPLEYREKIEHYMKSPFSEEGRKLSKEAISILSSDDFGGSYYSSYLRKMREDYIKNTKDMDYMFTLFK